MDTWLKKEKQRGRTGLEKKQSETEREGGREGGMEGASVKDST